MNRDVSPINEAYWVIPGKFMAGRYPALGSEINSKKTLNWLLEERINFIIDLTVEGEKGINPYIEVLQGEAEKNHCEVTYRRKPIQDYSVPDAEMVIEILDEIDSALEKGKIIYLHCQGGQGRTGLIVGCYHARHGLTGNQALKRIETLRKDIPGVHGCSPETEGQIRMVMEWKQKQ